MRNGPVPVVFTDLDGTLLDNQSYSFAAARDALERVRASNIPLVLCSSKTRMEIERVQQRIRIVHPFVSENGAAAFIPPGYFSFALPEGRERGGYHVLEFGWPYHEVVNVLRRTAEQVKVPIVGFSEMTVSEVAAACGLSMLDARLAKLREYDEPFRIVARDPSARDRLLRALHRAGLRFVSGGRFDHAAGLACKGLAVVALRDLYRRQFGSVTTVGLGDGPNDIALLRAVDVPLVVLNPAGNTAAVARRVPTARVTRGAGPAGWSEAVNEILDGFGVSAVGASCAPGT